MFFFEGGIVKQQIEGKTLDKKLLHFVKEEKKNLIKLNAEAKALCRKSIGTITEAGVEIAKRQLMNDSPMYKIIERFKEDNKEDNK